MVLPQPMGPAGLSLAELQRRSLFSLVEKAEAETMAVLRPDPATGPPTQHVGQTSTQKDIVKNKHKHKETSKKWRPCRDWVR